MRIYIIRHGQTEWNRLRRWQGSTDIALSVEGLAQAKRLAMRLSRYKIEQIYSSPLSRALCTAEAIRRNTNCPIVLRDDLKEIVLGRWEGHTHEEIAASDSELFRKWETEPSFVIGEGIENYQHLQDRAYNALLEIIESGFGEVLISTHGAWILALICKVLHIPLEHRLSLEIGNTSLNILDYNPVTKKIKVVTLNDVLHLEE